MKTIRQITAAETFPVRHPVLRPGKPLESCHFDGDDATATKHFGIFVDDMLVGVATLFENNNLSLNMDAQFQLRGMAVLEQHQKKGYGEDLVYHVSSVAGALGGKVLWFNARIVAVPFYEKLGYRILGEPFDIGDIGTHFVMFKLLKNNRNV